MKLPPHLLPLLLLSVCIAGCKPQNSRKQVLKMAHNMPTFHSVHRGLEYMGHCLDSLSAGTMKLEIYPSGQLGQENQYIELLQIGSLDMAKVSSGAMEGFIDIYKLFGLPYLFRSKEHYFSVLDGEIGEYFRQATTPYRFVGLGYYDSGARSFYTTDRPIRTPDDLKGLKIRVMRSPAAVDMMRTLGGSATPVDWGELYTALQSKVVDGAENNTPSVTIAFHHEVARYYTMDEHTMLPDVVIMSRNTWQQLTRREQEWVREATLLSVAYQRRLWEEQERASLAQMKEKGVEIIYPDKKPFMEKMAPQMQRYRMNPEYNALIERIVSTPDNTDTIP